MQIIGITGTIGAGKSTVAHILVKKHGFKQYSVRKFLDEILFKRKLESTRPNLVALADELRFEHGPEYIVMEIYKKAFKDGGDCIIESIRTIGEIESLRKMKNFTLLGVSAPLRLRYERVYSRGASTDAVSFEQFKKDQIREGRSKDPRVGNLYACLRVADIVIQNSGTVKQLESEIDKIFSSKKHS